MTHLEMQIKITAIRQELESRHKTGISKIAANGEIVPTEKLQEELFNLLYKISKLD